MNASFQGSEQDLQQAPLRAVEAPALPDKAMPFVLFCLRGFGLGLGLMLILETGQAACHILLPKAIQKILDGSVALQQSGIMSWDTTRTEMMGPILFFVLLNVGTLLFSRASGALLVYMGPSLRKKTRASLYNYLQYHSQRYFLGNFAGSLANRISEVAVSVNHTLWVVMFDFWPIAVTFTVSMILLAQVHTGMTLFLGGWIVVFVAASFILGRKCLVYAQEFAAKRSLVTGKIVDAVTNIQKLQALCPPGL